MKNIFNGMTLCTTAGNTSPKIEMVLIFQFINILDGFGNMIKSKFINYLIKLIFVLYW